MGDTDIQVSAPGGKKRRAAPRVPGSDTPVLETFEATFTLGPSVALNLAVVVLEI